MGQASQRRKILKPLEDLGLDKISDIEEALEKAFGKERADVITAEWDQRSKETDSELRPGSQNELYDFLHSDPELSMIVTCYTDASIIRSFCLWLYDHRSLFGKEILDAGCGTGILSCFIGLMLPDSHVTAIDRSESCIKTAMWIKEKIGAENVEFRCSPVEKVLSEESAPGFFDTVLSSRTFHENIGIRKTEIRFLPFSEQIKTYKSIYRDYCSQLSKRVKQDGHLICMERNYMDTELLGFFRALRDAGLELIPQTITELKCEESDFKEPSVFQAFAAKKKGIDGSGPKPDSNKPDQEDGLFLMWKEKAFSRSEDPEYYTRAQADWFTEENSDSMIEGYETFDANGTQLAKACLLEKKEDPEQFLMYQANYGKSGVQVLPYEALEEAKEIFADHKAVDAARGFEVREL